TEIANGIDHFVAIGPERGPSDIHFRCVGGQRFCRSARRGDSSKRGPQFNEDDCVVRPPCSTAQVTAAAQGCRNAAIERHLFQFSRRCGETHPFSVRRKERCSCSLGLRQRSNFQSIQ